MWWLEEWLKPQLPIELLPGLKLIVWVEVRRGPFGLFTTDVLRVLCDWFSGG
jgi:hypothetical protein